MRLRFPQAGGVRAGPIPRPSAFLLSLLLMGATPPLGPPDSLFPHTCLPGEEPTAITLVELWRDAHDREPAYRAMSGVVSAEETARSAVRREWAPVLSTEGLGNYGQRLSPGEERILGVGPRGEFRLLGSWSLLDSDRLRRGELADRRRLEAQAGEGAFDVSYRAALAAEYAAAAALEELLDARQAHLARLRELAGPIRERLAAGLDVSWEQHLVEEAVARAERFVFDAEQRVQGARAELSVLLDRCVRVQALSPTGRAAPGSPDASPAVIHLLRQADTRDAAALEEADRGRWQLGLIGVAGPNYSRAFDDGRVENEYLVGVTARWTPDLSGVRRRLAEAESLRADAIRSEAESLQLALEREVGRFTVELEYAELRRAGLEAELEQAERREEVALARWREGVDRWTEVVLARDRILELRILEIELRGEMALAHIRLGEATGDLEGLPARLGAEGNR